MIASMEEITIVVCGSKVHALRTLLNPELAERVLGFAIGDHILPGAPPGMWPDMCRKCRGPAQVDFDNIWVRLRWGVCLREQRVQKERQLARKRAYAAVGGSPAAGRHAPAAR